MEKFGFSLQDSYCLPMAEVIALLADTGFCAISPGWKRDGDYQNAVMQARALGMTVQSLHGPLRGMRAMWEEDPGQLLTDLMDSATACAQLEIPILVVHPWNSVDYSFHEDSLHFEHFDQLVDHAERLGICIAFENLEGPEFLAALMNRYSNVGFCWDSGHELCYAPGWDFLSRFGDRLVMTHLNDNLGVTDPSGRLQGTDDLHLLPGDGIISWDNTLCRLKNAKPQTILNFELKIRPKGDRCVLDLYSKMPLQNYFREAYRRAMEAVKGYWEEKA